MDASTKDTLFTMSLGWNLVFTMEHRMEHKQLKRDGKGRQRGGRGVETERREGGGNGGKERKERSRERGKERE